MKPGFVLICMLVVNVFMPLLVSSRLLFNVCDMLGIFIVNAIAMLLLIAVTSRSQFALRVLIVASSFIAPFNVWYVSTFNSLLSSEVMQYSISLPVKSYLEFLHAIIDQPEFVITCLVAIFFAFTAWRLALPALNVKSRRLMYASGLIIQAICLFENNVFPLWYHRAPLIRVNVSRNSFPVNFIHACYCKMLPSLNAATEPVVPVKVVRKNEIELETVVYVIGESARADHWHKNGYHRETTPFLDKQNIINFSKVRSYSDCTPISVPALFGMVDVHQLAEISDFRNGDQSIIQKMPGHPTLFDYFRSAGFFTYVFVNANQTERPMLSVGAAGDHFEMLPEKDSAYDLQMLPYLKQALAAPFSKKFIVLHTYGSHWDYNKRYPRKFDLFHSDATQLEQHKAYYDNSILATDSFLNDVILELKKIKGKVVMIYTSDHGEGNNQKMESHCVEPSNHTTLVPLFLWTNYNNIDKSKIAKLHKYTSRYISQESIAPTILDLVGISSNKIDFARALTKNIDLPNSYEVLSMSGKLFSCSENGCM